MSVLPLFLKYLSFITWIYLQVKKKCSMRGILFKEKVELKFLASPEVNKCAFTCATDSYIQLIGNHLFMI